MVQTGYVAPANKILMGPNPLALVQELKIETATGCVPGALVRRGTNDDDIVVGGVAGPVIGWLGYEQCNPAFMPDNITTVYAANAQVPVISGAGNLIKMPGGLAVGTAAVKGDYLLSWGAKVVPAVNMGGKYAVRIPFTKNTSETATGVVLPAGAFVRDVRVDVATENAAGTIDVGTLSTASGDADGFLDGESCAVVGYAVHNAVDDATAKLTIGDLLVEADIKTADTTALYYNTVAGYLVPAGGKQISYTTSNHTIAGNILVFVEGPGINVVGKCEKSVSAASAAADIQVRSLI